MVISVSKINAFKSCKHKYKLIYIDKVEQEQFQFFQKGSQVHKALENLSDPTTTNSVVSAFLASGIGKKYLDIILTGQKEVCFGLKNDKSVTPCAFDDPSAFFHGVIDVLNGNYILDYKTGKKKSFEDQDWKQLMFYSAWVFLKHPEFSEVHIAYLYVEHDHENCLTVKREYMNSILEKLLINVNEIGQYTENPTDEHTCSVLCDYCSCRRHCKFYSSLETMEFETIDGL